MCELVFFSQKDGDFVELVKSENNFIKTGKIDGKDVNLNEFDVGRETVRRNRNINREETMNVMVQDFTVNKPHNACLHWDSKQLKNQMGIVEECEAILVTGAPHHIEGKLFYTNCVIN